MEVGLSRVIFKGGGGKVVLALPHHHHSLYELAKKVLDPFQGGHQLNMLLSSNPFSRLQPI